MSERPAFILPPCPVCSSILTTERPIWRYARHTSAARKVSCFIWTGCVHAAQVASYAAFVSDPVDWERIQQAWADLAAKLFTERTASWTDAARDRFRRAISDRPELHIVGQQALPLSPFSGFAKALKADTPSPEAPAQQNKTTHESPYG